MAEHDAALRHDGEVERVGPQARIGLVAEAVHLTPALAEVEGLLGDHPAARRILLGTRLGFGPGSEHAVGRSLVASLQPDGAVLGRSCRHAAFASRLSAASRLSNRARVPCSRAPASSWPPR